MRIKGLPIGQGELWHDRAQRTLLVTLVSVALAPLLIGLAVALGLVAGGLFPLTVEPPLLALLAGLGAFAVARSQAMAARVGVAVLVGLLGGLGYNAALVLVRLAVPALTFPLATGGTPGLGIWAMGGGHWLLTVAAWGLAYALLAGKARWYYGVGWSATLWGVLAALSALPHGAALVPGGITALSCLLGIHLAFGGLIGVLNEGLQPAQRGQGKIIFLRDYAPRVKQR